METFRTRFGLLATLLGMAVGTGNIWRFPRILAQYGGAFLIPWAIFLFLWSLPLLMVEFSLGKRLRKGVVGSFASLTGGRWVWCGGFVVFCTLGIMCYYSVVTGWCLYYAGASAAGQLLSAEPRLFWEHFTQGSPWPLLLHAVCLVSAACVVGLGVQQGLERINRWMIPALVIILVFLAGYAVTVPGSGRGLRSSFAGSPHGPRSSLPSHSGGFSQSSLSCCSSGGSGNPPTGTPTTGTTRCGPSASEPVCSSGGCSWSSYGSPTVPCTSV